MVQRVGAGVASVGGRLHENARTTGGERATDGCGDPGAVKPVNVRRARCPPVGAAPWVATTAGSTATTITDDTQPSAANHPSVALDRSTGWPPIRTSRIEHRDGGRPRRGQSPRYRRRAGVAGQPARPKVCRDPARAVALNCVRIASAVAPGSAVVVSIIRSSVVGGTNSCVVSRVVPVSLRV